MQRIERIVKKVLSGHTSQETAYLVDDYPYGYHERTQIRYWLENKPTKGYRLCSQTKNPKTGLWNKPKASTYNRIAAAMYIDEKLHVTWSGLSEYDDVEQVKAFIKDFPGECRDDLLAWCVGKAAMKRAMVAENQKGLSGFTVNGVPQAAGPRDLEENTRDLEEWLKLIEVVRAMR